MQNDCGLASLKTWTIGPQVFAAIFLTSTIKLLIARGICRTLLCSLAREPWTYLACKHNLSRSSERIVQSFRSMPGIVTCKVASTVAMRSKRLTPSMSTVFRRPMLLHRRKSRRANANGLAKTDKKLLGALSLVSRYWRSQCEPSVFYSIRISNKTDLNDVIAFFHPSQSSSHFGNHVRYVNIMAAPKNLSPGNPPWLHRQSCLQRMFPNLENITLHIDDSDGSLHSFSVNGGLP